MSELQKVVVVGGGPVGALAALYAARRGYSTELYELRDGNTLLQAQISTFPDVTELIIRFPDPNYGDQSLRPDMAVIPLAISERGIQALARAEVPGLIDDILEDSRPV